MKFIGLTGGVGAGKTTVLKAMKQMYRVRILIADEIAHELMEPGTACYRKIREVFAAYDIWCSDGSIHRQKMAQMLFADEDSRRQLNEIVHPAVKAYVIEEVEKERQKNNVDYVIVEAALLIEEHYDTICDELWYVYASPEIRKKRLMKDRGYTEQKVEQIFAAQLSEEEYRRHCRREIDNTRDEQYVIDQIKILYANEEKQDGDTECRQ